MTYDEFKKMVEDFRRPVQDVNSHLFDLMKELMSTEANNKTPDINVGFECRPQFIEKYVPTYQTEGASGFDLRADLESGIVVRPGETIIVPTGMYFSIPKGYEIQVRSRSGIAAKQSGFVLNSPGTVDSDYRGEVKIIFHNAKPAVNHVGLNTDMFGLNSIVIDPGYRIAQAVMCPVVQAVFVPSVILEDDTERGAGGFGSTGVK